MHRMIIAHPLDSYFAYEALLLQGSSRLCGVLQSERRLVGEIFVLSEGEGCYELVGRWYPIQHILYGSMHGRALTVHATRSR